MTKPRAGYFSTGDGRGERVLKNKSFWILLILIAVTGAMLASGTFAWLMDTERIDADFQAGVLDIELGQSAGLEFQNLRPLSLAQFEAEFGAAYENVNTDGFDPAPVYFRPVTVNNTGTLPARITISVVNQGAPSGCRIKNMVPDGRGGIEQNGEAACGNELEDALKIYLYQMIGGQWKRIENINLNELTLDSGEKAVYAPGDTIGAGESVQYVIAAHLPETAGNDYQAKHFHGKLYVGAGQTDDGADIGGPAGSVTPEPGRHHYTIKHYITGTRTSVKPDETGSAPAGLMQYNPDMSPVEFGGKTYEPEYSHYSFMVEDEGANVFTVFYREVLTSGDGSSWDEAIIILTPEDLNNVRNGLDKYYKLGRDIDLSQYASWSPIGGVAWASGWFKGGLDGNGFKITNLKINRAADGSQPYTGLFGTVYDSSNRGEVKLKNIVVENADITVSTNGTNYHAGIIAGFCYGASIENCHTAGTLTTKGPGAGGIAGATLSTSYSSLNGGHIKGCSSSAQISSSAGMAGGIVGNVNIPVSECFFTGSVISSSSAVGGIAGAARNSGSVSNCWSSGYVEGAHVQSGGVGGIVGDALAQVRYCYTIAALNTKNNVNPATAAGRTAQPAVGHRTGTVSNVIFLKGRFHVKGTASAIWDDYSGSYLNGGGAGEEDMRTAATYSGWDVGIWDFTGGYPRLRNNMGS